MIRFLLAIILFTVLGFYSCAPVESGGSDNPVDATQKFLGTWNVNDQPFRINYIVEIKLRPGYDDQVILDNFADMGSQVFGLVVNNTIVIDEQSLGDPFKTEGTGTYINKELLEFDFMLDDGIDLDARKAAFTK